MSEEKLELIVHKEVSIARLIIIFVVLIGIGVGVIATLTLRDVRSKAFTPKSTSESLNVIPSPTTNLVTPYVRLVANRPTFSFFSTALIDVYLHTGSQDVIEAAVLIRFDPEVLSIAEQDIVFNSFFKSASALVSEEVLELSLFNNLELGHMPVQNEKEIKIATLNFKTKSIVKDDTVIYIDFEKDNPDKTRLFSANDIRSKSPTNLLESVENISFAIHP